MGSCLVVGAAAFLTAAPCRPPDDDKPLGKVAKKPKKAPKEDKKKAAAKKSDKKKAKTKTPAKKVRCHCRIIDSRALQKFSHEIRH